MVSAKSKAALIRMSVTGSPLANQFGDRHAIARRIAEAEMGKVVQDSSAIVG